MELRVLKYFLMAAREENITRAADILHITQPSLSRQIKQLEDELNVKLFNRHKHSISLTEDGRLLKRRAQELIELADKTQREFTHKSEALTGEIVIGCGEMKGIKALAPIFRDFRAKYPQVRFDIHSGMADDIKERLENGLADLGILMEPVDIGKYEFYRIPLKNRWGLFVHRDSKYARLESVQPQDIIDLPVFLPKRPIVQNEIFNWLGDYREKINIIGTCNLHYNASYIAAGSGCGILCIDNYQTLGDMVFVPFYPTLETASVLVWKKYQVQPPATAEFIRQFKQYLENITAHTK